MLLAFPYTGTAIIMTLIVFLIICAAFLIPVIFYFIELQNTLKEVSVENRKMKPGQVWLLLIPLFSVYWLFEVVSKIADSLKAEFASRNMEVNEERPGYRIGIIYAITGAVSPLLNIVTKLLQFPTIESSIISLILGLGGLVLWILYWVKIRGYRKMLVENSTNSTL